MGVLTGDVRHHSYHTFLWSLQRQIAAVITSPLCTRRGVARGMKSGNQLTMPSVPRRESGQRYVGCVKCCGG